jgi:molecular chaperone GrpE (heat shock protein)
MFGFFSEINKKICDSICGCSGEDKIEIENLKKAVVGLNKDFKNYRERIKRDSEKSRKESTLVLVEKLLPVLDSGNSLNKKDDE